MDTLPPETEAISADGQITKLLIKRAVVHSVPDWSRGCNARFHYSVYAYVLPKSPQNTEKNSNGHVHTKSCHHPESKAKNNAFEGFFKAKSENPNNEFMESQVDRKAYHKPGSLDLPTQESHSHTQVDEVSNGAGKTSHPNPPASERPTRTFISDSKTRGDPFELRIGYKFTFAALETCVIGMIPGETSRFLLMGEHVDGFAQLETSLRITDLNKSRKALGLSEVKSSGSCCANIPPEILAIHQDLDVISGAPIELQIELLEVENTDVVKREVWEMNTEEKYLLVPSKIESASVKFRENDFKAAKLRYEDALRLIQSVDSSGIVLDLKKDRMDLERDYKSHKTNTEPPLVPFGSTQINLDAVENYVKRVNLNLSACELKLGDHKACIGYCDTVLDGDSGCVKALWRRALCFLEIGRDLERVRSDFEAIERINGFVVGGAEWVQLQKQKRVLDEKVANQVRKEKDMYFGKLF